MSLPTGGRSARALAEQWLSHLRRDVRGFPVPWVNRWGAENRKFLRAAGIDAFKPYEEGHADSGDIHGIDPFIGQAKAYASTVDGIREGVAGAERQAVVAGQPFGVAIVKRPGKPTGEAYVVMRLDTFARLLRWLRDLPPPGESPSDPR